MKKLWILILLILSSCATKKVYDKPSERFVDVTSSHRYANMYLSSFFCENKRWPESLHELKQYTLPRKYRDGFNTQINWHDISFMRMKYIPSSVILTAPEENLGSQY